MKMPGEILTVLLTLDSGEFMVVKNKFYDIYIYVLFICTTFTPQIKRKPVHIYLILH